jgi:hypothetical protein
MDDSSVHDLVEQREGVRFFSFDKETGRRRQEGDSALNDALPRFRNEMENALRQASGSRRVLVAAVASQSAAAFAAETGCELISNPPELAAWLNDKTNFLNGLGELGLPRVPGRWTRPSQTRYAEVAAELGSSFVAQLAHGSSGSGTAVIQSEEDYQATGVRWGDALVWIAPDLGRLSVNINALALESGIAVSYPSVQLEGWSALNAGRGMYCGNDYVATAGLPTGTVCDVVEQATKIGRWIASFGFRGLFGLDFVLDTSSSKAYAVDLNPRWQGSTAPLTLAEYKAGRLPLVVAGLARGMGLMSEVEVLRHQDEFLQPVLASHMSLRCPATGWSRVTGNLQPGVYSFSRGLNLERPGLRLNDLAQPNEILVTGGVPRQGAWMAPTAHALRVSSEQQVMDVSRLRPLQWSRTVTEMLYAELALTPAGTE